MNPDNPFAGKPVAVTGKLVNYTRADINARLLGITILSKQEFEDMAV